MICIALVHVKSASLRSPVTIFYNVAAHGEQQALLDQVAAL